jgi:hypothetical protein
VIPMQIFPDLSRISHDHGSKSRGRTEVEKMWPKWPLKKAISEDRRYRSANWDRSICELVCGNHGLN